jgi:hypothetical protein
MYGDSIKQGKISVVKKMDYKAYNPSYWRSGRTEIQDQLQQEVLN